MKYGRVSCRKQIGVRPNTSVNVTHRQRDIATTNKLPFNRRWDK